MEMQRGGLGRDTLTLVKQRKSCIYCTSSVREDFNIEGGLTIEGFRYVFNADQVNMVLNQFPKLESNAYRLFKRNGEGSLSFTNFVYSSSIVHFSGSDSVEKTQFVFDSRLPIAYSEGRQTYLLKDDNSLC